MAKVQANIEELNKLISLLENKQTIQRNYCQWKSLTNPTAKQQNGMNRSLLKKKE